MLRVATRGKLPEHLWGVERNTTGKGAYVFADPHAFFASDELHDNSRTRWFEDDLQLSYKLSKLGLLAPPEIHSRFAIAQALPTGGWCNANPSGLHKPWATPWIHPAVIVSLLAEPLAHLT